MKIFEFGLRKTYDTENRLVSLKTFIKKYNITKVIDVRYDTGEQDWNCSSHSLKHEFKEMYVHFKQLGIEPIMRIAYKDTPKKLKQRYMKRLIKMHAEKLFEEFKDERIVLLCIENLDDPKTPYCHRIWLKSYLKFMFTDNNIYYVRYMKKITFFGNKVVVACDGHCEKAWGIDERPRNQLSDNIDDYELLSDSELGTAPEESTNAEGCYMKPLEDEEKLNKWCVRQCERSVVHDIGDMITLQDFSKRVKNIKSE